MKEKAVQNEQDKKTENKIVNCIKTYLTESEKVVENIAVLSNN